MLFLVAGGASRTARGWPRTLATRERLTGLRPQGRLVFNLPGPAHGLLSLTGIPMPSRLHLASVSDPGAHPQRGLPDLILEVSTPSTHSLNCLYLLSLIFFIATLFSSLPDPDGLSAYVPSNVSINLRHFCLTYCNIPAQFISSKLQVNNCAKMMKTSGAGLWPPTSARSSGQ